jgi:hypothetical protein
MITQFRRIADQTSASKLLSNMATANRIADLTAERPFQIAPPKLSSRAGTKTFIRPACRTCNSYFKKVTHHSAPVGAS